MTSSLEVGLRISKDKDGVGRDWLNNLKKNSEYCFDETKRMKNHLGDSPRTDKSLPPAIDQSLALDFAAHFVGEGGGRGSPSQVARQILSLGQSRQQRALDLVGVRPQADVPQKHHAAHEQSGGVGEILSGNIRRRAVHVLG